VTLTHTVRQCDLLSTVPLPQVLVWVEAVHEEEKIVDTDAQKGFNMVVDLRTVDYPPVA
jgi:hypothetical protein